MSIQLLMRVLVVAGAALGVFGGGALSVHHFHNGNVCPMLGPLPACYLVFVSYLLVVVSAFLSTVWFRRVFYIGWTPVFALAAIGAFLHTFIGDTCPVGESGIPQCYISLGLAVLIFMFSYLARHSVR